MENLYSNPVEVEAEFARLKTLIAAKVLASQKDFNLEVRHLSNGLRYYHQKLVAPPAIMRAVEYHKTLDQVKSILRETGIRGNMQSCRWKSCMMKSANLTVHASFCTNAVPHKLLQFIIQNSNLLDSAVHAPLYKAQNEVLQNFRLTAQSQLPVDAFPRTLEDANFSGRDDHHSSSTPDEWPIFVLWLEDHDFESDNQQVRAQQSLTTE